MKRQTLLPWALSGLLTVALLATVGHYRVGEQATPSVPILERMRALGELHTARYEYSDVVQHATYQKPQGFLAALPGADSVARATTENSALLNVQGRVEAGVDLAKMTLSKNPAGIKVTLPRAHLYAPELDAKLFAVKRGAFWRDDAITLRAVDVAKHRISEAAVRQGILRQAESEAVTRVQKLAQQFGATKVVVDFADSGSIAG